MPRLEMFCRRCDSSAGLTLRLIWNGEAWIVIVYCFICGHQRLYGCWWRIPELN